MIQMSMDQTLIVRSGYTVLDLLSDVGGLQGILIAGISIILSTLNHNHLGNYLASQLYRSDEFVLRSTQTQSVKQFCISKFLPKRLVCCHKDRQ